MRGGVTVFLIMQIQFEPAPLLLRDAPVLGDQAGSVIEGDVKAGNKGRFFIGPYPFSPAARNRSALYDCGSSQTPQNQHGRRHDDQPDRHEAGRHQTLLPGQGQTTRGGDR